MKESHEEVIAGMYERHGKLSGVDEISGILLNHAAKYSLETGETVKLLEVVKIALGEVKHDVEMTEIETYFVMVPIRHYDELLGTIEFFSAVSSMLMKYHFSHEETMKLFDIMITTFEQMNKEFSCVTRGVLR